MKPAPSLPPQLSLVSRADVAAALPADRFDALVVIGPAPLSAAEAPAALRAAIERAERTDRPLTAGRAVACVPAAGVPGERLVLSTTGPLSSWELDVRAFGFAAAAAVARAVEAGARRPLVWLAHAPREPRFARAREVAALGALAALWRPLELRLREGFRPAVDALGWVDDDEAPWAAALDLERARAAARDVTGTEPETMSPAGMGDYCRALFDGGPVEVSIEDDQARILAGYPLLAAVARASQPVEAHRPRVIRLVYEGEGEAERTLFFAGKGLVYDTGGADVKTDGHMAGMSRDKGGAGAVVGLFAALAARRPKGVRAVGLLGAVRNSVGPHGFVTDEIIAARSGVRVRIGNTDAEGRLVLADLLAALREEAAGRPDPHLFSLATLTGHAALSYGPYTALLENGPARAKGLGDALERAGEAFGDPFERSRLRPEDYAFIVGRSAAEDVLSCNTLPSARTARGHQFPAALLDVVSGLRAHHAKGGAPIAFAHLDIAGSVVSGGTWQTGTPTGAPVVALMHGLALALSAHRRARPPARCPMPPSAPSDAPPGPTTGRGALSAPLVAGRDARSAPSPARDARLDALARLAVESLRAAPCAVVGAWADGHTALGAWGLVDGRPAATDTIFDLASITKPLIALAAARLARQGRLPWSTPLGALLPELADAPAARAPLELFFAHRAGLEAHLPLYATAAPPGEPPSSAAMLAAAAASLRPECRGVTPPPEGHPPVYSDMGYLLAGEAVARAAGRPLAALVDDEINAPLGTRFEGARALLARAPRPPLAPTEIVPGRGGALVGVVHDENAWAFGGLDVCGHAGLFGAAADLLTLGAALLEALAGRRPEWLTPAELAPLVRRRPGGSLRAGFDGKSGPAPSAGARSGPNTFGHLGFTGTSLWVDPDARLAGALLTNRVHPTRNAPEGIRAARPLVHDGIKAWAEAGGGEAAPGRGRRGGREGALIR